ncbi:hypothetical protein Q9189_003481 [Teloschistes chrysophthalmus]
MVNGGYYKGTRSGSMGRHTKHGGYIIDYAKVRTYVVPKDLKDFKYSRPINGNTIYPAPEHTDASDNFQQLTPFVTKNMEPPKGEFGGDPKGPLSGERYLERWKSENGTD